MTDRYPGNDRYFVLKEDQSIGPFDIDEILMHIDEGRFSYEDVCLKEGGYACQRLRDVLDWDESDSFEPQSENPETTTELPSLNPGMILYQGHPSLLSYPLSFCTVVGGIVGGIWLLAVDMRLALLSFGFAVFSLGYLSLKRFTNDYLVTRRRIELIVGLFARSSNEVRITDIRAINVSCSGFSGLLGIGTVDFFTAGDSPEISFQKIWAAKQLKELIRRLQDNPD